MPSYEQLRSTLRWSRSFDQPGDLSNSCHRQVAFGLIDIVEKQAEQIAALTERLDSNDADLDTAYDSMIERDITITIKR